MTIKRELKDLDGVIVQDVDLATKTVTLNVASEETLAAAMALLTEIGYPPVRQD
jgi:copper chaperone CopZ